METSGAERDMERGSQLLKDEEAVESATRYLKPSVEECGDFGIPTRSVAYLFGTEPADKNFVLRLNKDQKRANVGWSYPLTSTDAKSQSGRKEPRLLSCHSYQSQAETVVEGQPVSRCRHSPAGKNSSSRPIEQPFSIPPSRARNGAPAYSSWDSHIAYNQRHLHEGGRQSSSNDHRAGLNSDSDEWTDSWDEIQETNATPRPTDRIIREKIRPVPFRERPRSSVTSRETRYTTPRVAPPIILEDERRRHMQDCYHTDPIYCGHVLPYPPIPCLPHSRPCMNSAPYPYQDFCLPSIPQNFTGDAELPIPPIQQLHHRTPSYPKEQQRMSPSVHESKHSSSQPKFPLAPVPDIPVPANDVDPIKIVEEYLESLKKSKERELLDANRILSWINRRSGSTNETNESLQAPDIDSYRVYDEDSDTESDVSSENHPASTTRPCSGTLEPTRSDISNVAAQRVSFQDQIPLERTQDQILEQVVNSSTGCSSQNGCSSPRPAVTREIQADLQPNAGSPHKEPADRTPENIAITQERDALQQEMAILKRQLEIATRSWFNFSIRCTYSQWKKLFRRGPPPGTQRLEWICECGEDMFADLPVASGSEYREMLEFLREKIPSTTATDGHSATPSEMESGLAQSDFTLPDLSQSGISNGNAPSSTIGSSSTYIGSSSPQTLSAQQTNPFTKNKYLELCVNVAKYETKLAEIQIMSSSTPSSTICTDAHLFRKIHERYFALRKYTWRRFLYQPVGIKFVHFGVQAGSRVGFFSDSPLPSEEVVASKRYEYNLQPPVPPPIDSRTFLHYFWKHSTHSQSTSTRYVDRIPKKLGESLIRSLGTDELREGWGIHIIEGPNKAVICWMLLVILGASFAVSLGYDMMMRVEDSGFAIGQWMVAALTVGLTALYFSLEDEVNTSFD